MGENSGQRPYWNALFSDQLKVDKKSISSHLYGLLLLGIVSICLALLNNYALNPSLPLLKPYIGYVHISRIEKLGVSLKIALDEFQKGTIFVDSRTRDKYERGHIPGAINIPLEEFDQHINDFFQTVPLDSRIITYCDGEKCESSKDLALELEKLGYKNVKSFFGGWNQWTQANLPVEEGSR